MFSNKKIVADDIAKEFAFDTRLSEYEFDGAIIAGAYTARTEGDFVNIGDLTNDKDAFDEMTAWAEANVAGIPQHILRPPRADIQTTSSNTAIQGVLDNVRAHGAWSDRQSRFNFYDKPAHLLPSEFFGTTNGMNITLVVFRVDKADGINSKISTIFEKEYFVDGNEHELSRDNFVHIQGIYTAQNIAGENFRVIYEQTAFDDPREYFLRITPDPAFMKWNAGIMNTMLRAFTLEGTSAQRWWRGFSIDRASPTLKYAYGTLEASDKAAQRAEVGVVNDLPNLQIERDGPLPNDRAQTIKTKITELVLPHLFTSISTDEFDGLLLLPGARPSYTDGGGWQDIKGKRLPLVLHLLKRLSRLFGKQRTIARARYVGGVSNLPQAPFIVWLQGEEKNLVNWGELTVKAIAPYPSSNEIGYLKSLSVRISTSQTEIAEIEVSEFFNHDEAEVVGGGSFSPSFSNSFSKPN